MEQWEALVVRYRRDQRTALVDSVAAGLSFADEAASGLGLIESAGLAGRLLASASVGLPFVLVVLSEGGRMLRRKKTATAGLQDMAGRALRMGAAMGAGAAAASLAGGFLPAIPVAMGVRSLLDSVRSGALAGRRVQMRILRLRALQRACEERMGGSRLFLPNGQKLPGLMEGSQGTAFARRR